MGNVLSWLINNQDTVLGLVGLAGSVWGFFKHRESRRERLRRIAMEAWALTVQTAEREQWDDVLTWKRFVEQLFSELADADEKVPSGPEFAMIRQVITKAAGRDPLPIPASVRMAAKRVMEAGHL